MITTWDAGRRAVMGILLAGSLALVACGEAANSQGDDGAIPTDEPRVSFQSDDGQETRTSSDLDPDGGDDADTPVGDDGRDEVAPASPDSGDGDGGGQEVYPEPDVAESEESAPEPEQTPQPTPVSVDARTRTISGEQSDPESVAGTVIGSWSVRGTSVSGVTEACIYKDGKAIVVMARRRVTGTWDSPDTHATGTVRDGNGTPILTMTVNPEDDSLSWRQVSPDGGIPVGGEDVATRRR